MFKVSARNGYVEKDQPKRYPESYCPFYHQTSIQPYLDYCIMIWGYALDI